MIKQTHSFLLSSLYLILLTGCQSISEEFVYEEINPIESFSCDNDISIECYGSACTADTGDDYAKLRSEFDGSGQLEVCIREGCWIGEANVAHSDSFLVLTGDQISFITNDETEHEPESVAIVLDKFDSMAIIKAGIYSLPVFCN